MPETEDESVIDTRTQLIDSLNGLRKQTSCMLWDLLNGDDKDQWYVESQPLQVAIYGVRLAIDRHNHTSRPSTG